MAAVGGARRVAIGPLALARGRHGRARCAASGGGRGGEPGEAGGRLPERDAAELFAELELATKAMRVAEFVEEKQDELRLLNAKHKAEVDEMEQAHKARADFLSRELMAELDAATGAVETQEELEQEFRAARARRAELERFEEELDASRNEFLPFKSNVLDDDAAAERAARRRGQTRGSSAAAAREEAARVAGAAQAELGGAARAASWAALGLPLLLLGAGAVAKGDAKLAAGLVALTALLALQAWRETAAFPPSGRR